MRKSSHVGWVVAVALVAAAAACSSSSTSSGAGGTGSGTQAAKTVGSAGGTVATPDGSLTVSIPAGALPADTEITISEISAPPAGAIGKAYEIGPTGTQFAAPVTLAFKYASADLMGIDPTSLEAATIAGSDWIALAGDSVDTASQIASGTTMHLSPYGLHARHGGGGADSGSSSDASTSADTSTSNDSGGSSDAGASSDASFDANGCSMMMYQVGSCANHPINLTCPGGTFVGSCTNNMGVQGFVLECCPNDGG